MSSLNEVCQNLVSNTDDALGAAVVDLNTGLMMAVAHNVPYFTQSYLDAVGAAAVDMFRGKTVSNVEKLLSNQRGKDSSKSIQEVQMTTEYTYHFMSVVPGKESALAVLITGRKANLGMGWAGLRSALADMAAFCP